jgi:predicted nucleotidyltransferase
VFRHPERALQIPFDSTRHSRPPACSPPSSLDDSAGRLRAYTGTVAVKQTLPADIDRRIIGLGDAITAASGDVEFAYLFGSAAAGALGPRSDIDLAIFVAADADATTARLAVARAAARHLGTDAVDVVLLNAAPISLAGRVLTHRRVLVDRVPFARHRYESTSARMFQDFRIREHRLLVARRLHG